jgi:hypothetical protein
MSSHRQIHFPGLLLRCNGYQPSSCFPWSGPNLPVRQKQEKTYDRYTRAGSPIAPSAGFGVGTCVIVYSWSPSFTTAPLAFPHRRPADSPRPHVLS